MSPRKKSKPNPKAPAQGDNPPEASTDASDANVPPTRPGTSETAQTASSDRSIAESALTQGDSNGTTTPSPASTQTLNKRPSRKWLGGRGSWRSKAPAIAQLRKESIGVSGGATSELPGKDSNKAKEQSPAKLLTKRRSSKGNALPASMTKLNVSSDGSVNEPSDKNAEDASKEPSEAPSTTPSIEEPPLPPEPPKDTATPPASTFGWRSWWSRPDGYPDGAKKAENTNDASTTPLPGATPSEEADSKAKELGSMDGTQQSRDQDTEMKDAPEVSGEDTEMKDAPAETEQGQTGAAPTTSWFWSWSRAQNAQSNPPSTATVDDSKAKPDEVPPVAEPTQEPPTIADVPPADITKDANKETPKPSGWAFWYKEKPKEEDKSSEGTSHKQVGEVAVFNTPSQSCPEAAQFNEQEQPKEEPAKVEEPPTKRSFLSLRGRPKVKAVAQAVTLDTPSSSKAATPSKTSPAPSPTRPDTAPAPQAAPKQAVQALEKPNIVLPEFKNTYRMVQKPTYWQQIRQYFLGGEPAMPHLHINPAPPRIKKAIAIGVHGFFPHTVVQKILGQPTGTSVRFANLAATAIKSWTEEHGYSAEIEQIALEGEGFISERVNTLWKLLLNWIEHVKEADFILVACHSQGVPVAMMLVAKLIQFGCVNGARIGVCAMAGINLGPFPEYRTKYLGPTAAELFEFGNPKSLVSQMYLAALDEVLRYGVRITYVGSIDDQLVSLESSTFSNLSHPYIYRAVFIDGRLHAPDFLTHLVGFSFKLRNLGLPDHGLIRELSPALAGSLYGGEGHSRVYEDVRVYELAVQHALETTSLPVQAKERPSTAASFKGINIPIPGAEMDKKDPYALKVTTYEKVKNDNPYFLPWAMRGLLEEDLVKKELSEEVEHLLKLFEEWNPTTKVLKDIKFRLDAVRSKL
ncbi:hypothetical protein BDV96DRAFT_561762 [Lophiotrema nucula]|uniref:YMC020W-like alpha/beta hydrolase domain-containing protein n=1 Tax=Lophiotrema nucula TaxID=690887 RepID=A0A6A5ZVG7_9PLEO|nr:hypothetical protein BDV96DRAFT_561762 [Lophiotrema nucula]